MKSFSKRKCNSPKTCARCENEIKLGEIYWSSPYKALCVACYDIEAKVNVSVTASAETKNDNYVVSGPCGYCPEPAIGMLWNKKVCLGHINQAMTDNI